MDTFATLALFGLGAAASAGLAMKLKTRLELSRAKHRSLGGHARLSRRVAALIPYYAHDEQSLFDCDGAPPEIARRRRDGLERLAALYRARFPRTLEASAAIKPSVSDLQFTSLYRVPFPYSRLIQRRLPIGAFYESSAGVMLTDLDGNDFYDLTASYGVNVFGYDFYKHCIARGSAMVERLGPVLGAYHPALAYNVARIKEISGLDEVSFHMSGTEAVMQAVRLARYHSGRTHLVRFSGAYHGWWGDVQPGVGNPLPADYTYTLADMAETTLRVLRKRRDIACVLVNPLQALHPNAGAPADSSLIDSSGRRAGFERQAYADWLRRLREVCTERGIVLIFDEIFVGFRLAPGGAQEYFGVRADMVTYGKTLGGGLPVGVVCGRADLMRRYRDDRPADVCFARGTFNSHPYVMGAMHAFLEQLATPPIQALYAGLDERWNTRADGLNQMLAAQDLPVRVANLSTIWTVCYTRPSRFNWMLQYYLRAAGLALSWVGTGRILFSLNYTEAEFAEVATRFVGAVRAMQDEGWWWADPTHSDRSIRRSVLREMLAHRFKSNAQVAQVVPQRR